jgi:hypothetical protein
MMVLNLSMNIFSLVWNVNLFILEESFDKETRHHLEVSLGIDDTVDAF